MRRKRLSAEFALLLGGSLIAISCCGSNIGTGAIVAQRASGWNRIVFGAGKSSWRSASRYWHRRTELRCKDENPTHGVPTPQCAAHVGDVDSNYGTGDRSGSVGVDDLRLRPHASTSWPATFPVPLRCDRVRRHTGGHARRCSWHRIPGNVGRRESREGGDELEARQNADSSTHRELEKNTVLTAGTASRRGTRLSSNMPMVNSP